MKTNAEKAVRLMLISQFGLFAYWKMVRDGKKGKPTTITIRYKVK